MVYKPIYILILLFTIVIDYFAGLLIEKIQNKTIKKRFLIVSLIANIGILAFFKYYNFLNDQLTFLTTIFKVKNNIPYLNIILPIGLSFHTFQAMSYTLEVYRGNQRAEKHFGVYALYVMFYPQLVAGPIERPQNILHQFHEKKQFNYENLFFGIKQIILGLFKKIVIADRLSSYVDSVYSQVDNSNSISVFIAIVFFSFQIYCDFSGYSDIALGSARVMGFDLMKNFNNPFTSQNITEFWRKWHISLSTWFNDYLFTPLVIKFRDFGILGIALSLLITFAISGLWHGAGWTFIIYGLLHGLALVYEIFTKKKRKLLKEKINPFFYQNLSIVLTFLFVSFSWIFFRSENINKAVKIIKKLFSFTFSLNLTQISADLGPFNLLLSFLVLFLLKLIYNLYQSKKDTTFFVITILLIIILGTNNAKNFIYFQF